MARRVKNQSSWLDAQRNLWKMWRENISHHSQSAKDELISLEKDYHIQSLMSHPERYEGSLGQIKEFMNALEDIQRAVEREKLYQRGGPREREWKEPAIKKVVRGRSPGIRTQKAPLGIDPRTGELIPVISEQKGIGENVSGITYRVDEIKTSSGIRYRFRITKSGRVIEPMRDPTYGSSPQLYDHTDQKILFKTPEEARLRARRVIHAALIWYEERGRKIQERVRKAGRRKEIHEAIQRTKRPSISRRIRKEHEAKKLIGSRFKSLKGNPIFGSGSSDTERQAKAALAEYKSSFRIWERSFNAGRPNYSALMHAYDMLENARANFSIGGNKKDARSVQGKKEELKEAIIALMAATSADEIISAAYDIRSNPSNPPKNIHHKIGKKFLSKYEKSWKKYLKSHKLKDLLDAYEDLIISERELSYAKDKKQLNKVKIGIKTARSELSKKKKN